jgi:hypothetical protein
MVVVVALGGEELLVAGCSGDDVFGVAILVWPVAGQIGCGCAI